MIDHLSTEELRIKKLVDSTAENIGAENEIIYDGIANIENYLSQEYKILFLLKESYETKGNYKWQVGIIYNHSLIRKYPTLKRIGYITNGIKNNSCYDDVKKEKNIILKNDIESIAWVNINKIAAKSHSQKDLTKKYDIWKHIIAEQINVYNPNIIICGNTLQYIKSDMGIVSLNKVQYENKSSINSVYISNNRLYIQTAHPGKVLSRSNEKIYVDSIINLVKEWKNSNLTTAST